MVLQRIIKPKNQRVKRVLEKRQPQVHENTKQAMFIRGGHTSETVTEALKDLYSLKKTDSTMLQKKNILRPFEDMTSLEFFSSKNDASLFMFGSHQKKRPNNLVLGRFFDHHLLDMVELGIDKFKSMAQFKCDKCATGTKPCLLFSGEAFDTDHEYKRLKNMLIDFFRGPTVENIRLAGLEHVLNFTVADGKLYIRSYRILLKKSGSRTPRIELEEMGPSLDLTMRRTKLASADLYKTARKQPKTAKPKKRKNISKDVFGTRLGRIHMEKQDMTKLQTRKMKGLKRKPIAAEDDSETGKKSKTSEPSDEN
ncbi:unnamed protein product [Owenia fusiformis]|uniref:Ribosome production factor 2 homolog n=1 Tax=Owenia fusiformis TaxID=6347 RepID=A0A8J1XIG3_OWEFU|nr:unnamed protein product [Owenia fusiformis]